MKKYLILSALLILVETNISSGVPRQITSQLQTMQQDSLKEYTGKYQMQQGQQVIYADVYVENGKLNARSSAGGVLVLNHNSGDNFIVSQQGTAIKFLRDGAKKVTQIAVMGNVMWTRISEKAQTPQASQPATAPDYLGKYQITVNGQNLAVEVSLKDGQLWCTQLWDGANSALDYISGDDFTIRALSLPIKFKRDKDNKVVQLLLNGTDLFIKVKK